MRRLSIVLGVLGIGTGLFAVKVLSRLFLNRRRRLQSLSDAEVHELTTQRYQDAEKDLRRGAKTFDAIVIGGGIGGLTTASALAQQGWKVLVLEQHDRMGGATHVFDSIRPQRPQESPLLEETDEVIYADWNSLPSRVEFDTGYHYTCGPFADIRSRAGGILNYLCGRSSDWVDLGDPYDRVMFPHCANVKSNQLGINEYRFVRGKKELVEELVRQLLLQVKDEEFKAAVEPLLRKRFLLFNKMCNDAARTASKLFFARALPRLPFFGRRIEKWGSEGILKYGRLSTAYVIRAVIGAGLSEKEVLGQKPAGLSDGTGHSIVIDGALDQVPTEWEGTPLMRFKDEYLRLINRAMALAVHPIGDYAAQPRDSSFLAHGFVINYYRHGSSYPKGSAQRISAGMVARVKEAGGLCLCSAEVIEILLSPDRSTTVGVRVRRSGSSTLEEELSIPCTRVINAAGIYHLYRPDGLLKSRSDLVAKFKSVPFRPSTGHVYLFVILRGTTEELQLDKTNLWCLQGEGKDGNAIDPAYDSFFKDPHSVPNSIRPPAVYITFPSSKQPVESRPAAATCSQFAVSNAILFCDADYNWFTPWAGERIHQRGADYDSLKEKFAQSLLSVLFEKRPDLKSKIVWYEVGTPLTSEYYLGAFRGADYGTRIDCDYFSEKGIEWLMKAETPIQGLWQSGQDAMTPSISGAMHGGLLCALRVLGIRGSFWLVIDLLGFKSRIIREELGVSRWAALKQSLLGR